MNRFGKIIIVLFAGGWLVKEIVLPSVTALMFSKQFMEQVIQCDTAMEDSWYYRQEDRIDKNSESVQLLVCHEYDKTRKILLMSGLPEIYLSWLGLQSLELYQRPPEEYVESHRFTKR